MSTSESMSKSTSAAPPLALVAAIAENGVIGSGGTMPWRLPSDLKHFREVTMGKPLLMGRRTFESIGRALPGRETIVVTRDMTFAPKGGVHVAHDVETALTLARARAVATGAEKVILAGGGDLYEHLIGAVELMHLTFVEIRPQGDVFFPALDWSQWEETQRVRPPRTCEDEAAFSFVDYRRRSSTAANPTVR
jgi:Dihydrofolate reductase